MKTFLFFFTITIAIIYFFGFLFFLQMIGICIIGGAVGCLVIGVIFGAIIIATDRKIGTRSNRRGIYGE